MRRATRFQNVHTDGRSVRDRGFFKREEPTRGEQFPLLRGPREFQPMPWHTEEGGCEGLPGAPVPSREPGAVTEEPVTLLDRTTDLQVRSGANLIKAPSE